MIYTVTLNPAIDKTAVIPGFLTGRVNRMASLREDAGGKGINVSKCLLSLGTKSVTALLLAGETGGRLEALAAAEGLTVLTVQGEGQTRTNLKIIDPQRGENTDINEPGPVAGEETLQKLLDMLCKQVCKGDIVVLSGSLPKGVPTDIYGVWTRRFSQLGAQVLLDADGESLARGIPAGPYLVKPNEAELARLLGRPMESEEQLLAGSRQLLAMGAANAVISLGGDGALFLLDGRAYRAKGLPVPVQSTVGAGDAVVAAMAYGLEKSLPAEATIPLAMAMGAASVMQSGSQAPDAETVRNLAKQVTYEEL